MLRLSRCRAKGRHSRVRRPSPHVERRRDAVAGGAAPGDRRAAAPRRPRVADVTRAEPASARPHLMPLGAGRRVRLVLHAAAHRLMMGVRDAMPEVRASPRPSSRRCASACSRSPSGRGKPGAAPASIPADRVSRRPNPKARDDPRRCSGPDAFAPVNGSGQNSAQSSAAVRTAAPFATRRTDRFCGLAAALIGVALGPSAARAVLAGIGRSRD